MKNSVLEKLQELKNLKEVEAKKSLPKNISVMGSYNKAPSKAKEPIKMYFKDLVHGNKSIYLAYRRCGRSEYEFLRLYLVPEETSADKKKNAETMQLANAIKAQRIVELQNSTHGFSLCNTRSNLRRNA
jgi:hypothetical protein